ncbi:MAG: type II toxin-antitoxin system RelE/ParE family toxin [Patescibacteria group bacterium]|nr:type II toxin-antitoxin system RelE/ParE family toxin [Patescibacteria group bacterium]
MDKLAKALKKLLVKEKKQVKAIFASLKRYDFDGLDIKKLKGRDNIYRVRKGNLRIIYYNKEKEISILALERRSDNTYKTLK